jgi:hypothetical protein
MTPVIYPANRSEYFDDPTIDGRRKELQVTVTSFDELIALIKKHEDGESSFRHIPGTVFEDTFFPGCVLKFLWYAPDKRKALLCQAFGFPDDSVLESWALRKTYPSTYTAQRVLLTMAYI